VFDSSSKAGWPQLANCHHYESMKEYLPSSYDGWQWRDDLKRRELLCEAFDSVTRYLTFSVSNENQVINVQVPFLFKLAVDWLAALAGTEASLASFTDANATMLALFASPAAVLIGYGIARSGASACTGNTSS
jgi:hypothetical protein